MSKIHNFSAGPCILPPEVIQGSADAVTELNGIGLSLIEISHRSKDFVAVMDEARQLVKDLLNIPDRYEVLFLQGGASLGFLTSAYNFLSTEGKAAYVNTGTWAKSAVKEAGFVGKAEVIASSEADNYNAIPEIPHVGKEYDYLHITSNNTIFGTQYKSFPKPDCNLICDMSSDIFSKEINVEDFALIYAGAQKNMGPAGTVLYIVDTEKLGKSNRPIPSYLDLQVHIKKESMFNTPPVFPVYASMLMLRWLRDLGGVKEIAKVNRQKADLMYQEIDRNSLFQGHAIPAYRSDMNATFMLKDEQYAADFDELWKAAGISGIKGHRSVGGYRSSMYNALPLESVQVLVEVMKELESKKG